MEAPTTADDEDGLIRLLTSVDSISAIIQSTFAARTFRASLEFFKRLEAPATAVEEYGLEDSILVMILLTLAARAFLAS